ADYHMPGIDGATLGAMIKQDAELRDTVFVMLTSLSHWRELKQFEGNSIDACLIKPVRQSQLMDTLAAAWSKKPPKTILTASELDPCESDPRVSIDALESALGRN